MIGFIVPVKPKGVSKDWTYDNLLLERTAKSICAQTDQAFRLVIVYNDFPQINFAHPNIIFVHYPFSPVRVNDIEDLDYVLKYYSEEYAEKMMDKGKKIHYGCKIALEAGCKYMMGIDSDDLISNKIAAFVNKNSRANKAGWRIKKGFIYEEGSRILIKQHNIQNINGGTHIIRYDLITIPDFSTNLFWNYNLFEAHGYTYYRIRDFHHELLDDYPYPGLIYIVHKNNYSNILKLTKAVTFKNIVKKIVRGKLISANIRKEFNLYNLERTTN
ncbi:MAG TPA: hypothetical protein VIJ95_13705 [Hanamia sp.]